MKKNEQTIECVIHQHIHRKGEKGLEKILEEIMVESFPSLMKTLMHLRSTTHCKWSQCKESHTLTHHSTNAENHISRYYIEISRE